MVDEFFREWILGLATTGEDEDAVAGEAKLVAEEVLHQLDVLDRALELVGGARVADADEDGALLAAGHRVAGRHLAPGGRRRPRRRRKREREGVVHAAVPLDARHAAAERAPDAGARPRRRRHDARAAVPAPRRHPRRPGVAHAADEAELVVAELSLGD